MSEDTEEQSNAIIAAQSKVMVQQAARIDELLNANTKLVDNLRHFKGMVRRFHAMIETIVDPEAQIDDVLEALPSYHERLATTYQIVALMAYRFGVLDDPVIDKTLTMLSDPSSTEYKTLLPFSVENLKVNEEMAKEFQADIVPLIVEKAETLIP